MGTQCNKNLSRAISVADFILEDNGHSIAEAAEEFRLGETTIKRDINCLGSCAFYENLPNKKELQQKYIDVKKTLARLAKLHHVNNLAKFNISRKRATSK